MAAYTASNDGSENVSDFLRRIKELGDGTDEDDALNARKIEDDILEGRKQREARRAERARSISPEKQSPATSLRSYQSPRSPDNGSATHLATSSPLAAQTMTAMNAALRSPSTLPSPAPESTIPKASQVERSPPIFSEKSSVPASGSSVAQDGANTVSFPPTAAPASSVPTRSGTLSWQQRPTSLRGGVRSRPLSLVGKQPAPTPAAAAAPTKPPSASAEPDSNHTSRTQIAQALGSKDPSWFRQTPDRGVGSAAYRRQQDDADSTVTVSSQPKQLHGMSKEPRAVSPTISPAHSNIIESLQTSVSRSEGIIESSRPSSPLKDDSLASDPRTEESVLSDSQNSSLPDVLAPQAARFERPVSPTKGVGGFVQSAMMKRSDSIGKRWSVQTGAGVARQNSARRNMNLASGLSASASLPRLPDKDSGSGRETPQQDGEDEEEESRPTTLQHTRSQSSASLTGGREAAEGRPASPSKRWSPVKSSWLDSALNKPPESPKAARPESIQPSWMADLNKRKQKAASQDLDVLSKQISPDKADSGDSWKQPTPNFQAPPVKPKPEFSGSIASSKSLAMSTPPVQSNFSEKTEFAKATNVKETVVKETVNEQEQPEPPPKKDFRSSLQSRPSPSPTKTSGGELEFQNVFGKLKRTETKNYVAPDDLKDNIMRGKAALSMSSGPQKSVIRDEFKESILGKKDAMKAKAAEPPGVDVRNRLGSKKEDSPVPEAIAKRQAMSKASGNIVNRQTSKDDSRNAPVPAASQKFVAQNQVVENKPSSSPTSAGGSAVDSPSSVYEEQSPVIAKEPPVVEKIASGKLAGRFNPNLANLIARGPASRTPPKVVSPDSGSHLEVGPAAQATSTSRSATPSDGGKLQHMTKARARGPKRRLPTANHQENPVAEPDLPVVIPKSIQASSSANVSKPPTPRSSSRKVTPSKPPALIGNTGSQTSSTSKPPTPAKSIRLSDPQILEQSSHAHDEQTVVSQPNLSGTNSKSASLEDELTGLQITRNNESAALRPTRSNEQTSEVSKGSVKTAMNGLLSKPEAKAQVRAPIKLPTREDEARAHADAGLQRDELPTPISSTTQAASPTPRSPSMLTSPKPKLDKTPVSSTSQSSPLPESPLPATPVSSRSHPQTPSRNVTPSRPLPIPKPKPVQVDSPGAFIRTADSKDSKLSDCFDETPNANIRPTFDTQAILDNDRAAEKVKTLRKHIVELTGDGKTVPIGQNEEHILYSDSMYLCTHVFGDSAGARITEAYVWAGTGVSESAIEDAQVFAKKHSKDHGARLFILRQNRETENFLQALGGIVIIRAGKRNVLPRPYMLCGRSHLGHIAFDEVDFGAQSLCSGFPFIIAADAAIFYLWKGHGCNADEIGSARLISMDLGPNSNVVEVKEGEEPADFFSIFPPGPGREPARSAVQWPLKSKYSNYNTRLFRIEDPSASPTRLSASPGRATVNALWSYMRRPSQADVRFTQTRGPTISGITEIRPFCQSDLEPEHIYLLDAFFELYVIVGTLTSSKAHVFSRALLFAQDYAIVAASSEDRPSVPIGTVVLEGAPPDMKAVFRGWDESYVPTAALMAGRAKGRTGQLNTVPLNQAIDMIRNAN